MLSFESPVPQFSSERPKVGGAVCQKLIILAVSRINRKAPIHHKPTILKMKHFVCKVFLHSMILEGVNNAQRKEDKVKVV